MSDYSKIGALIIRGRKMLLITATADPYTYTLPGGPDREGVSAPDLLADELRAELGVEFGRSWKRFGLYDVTSNIDCQRVISWIYRVEIHGEPETRQPGRRLIWANPSTDVRMSTTVQAVMRDAVAASLIDNGETHG